MKHFIILSILIFSACGQKEIQTTNPAPQPTIVITPEKPFRELTADTVVIKLKEAGLPILEEIKYTEETDPNHLLGRPNQYVEKINFSDKRTLEKGQKQQYSVEVFEKTEDLENRKNYTENISKGASMFAQYIYTHKNVLLRLPHKLLPKDAKQYEEILKSL